MKRERVPRPGTLRMDTEQTDGGGYVVEAAGELDRFTAASLVETLDAITGSQPASVVLDLSGCVFLDSSGISALIEADKALRRSGTRLELVVSAVVSRTLRATGLEAHFPIRASRPPPRRDDDDADAIPVLIGFPPDAR